MGSEQLRIKVDKSIEKGSLRKVVEGGGFGKRRVKRRERNGRKVKFHDLYLTPLRVLTQITFYFSYFDLILIYTRGL